MRPAVCLGPGQEDHGFLKRRADLEHGAMLFCEVCKERWKVAVANMWIEQQLTKRDSRNFLRQGGMSKQRAGEVVGDRIGNGPAYQIHLADELDAFLCLVIELEHEAEDVARIDEADNNDISRVRDLVAEDHLADARFDRLDSSAFLGAVEQFRMSGGGSERPAVAGVVFQDLQVNQAVESRVNNRLRTGSKPFDPVLGVSLNRFAGDFLQNWVQCRVARFRPVHKVQCFHIRVDSRHERKLREDGADEGAVQVPAGYLVEVAALFVEERQDEFFGQT